MLAALASESLLVRAIQESQITDTRHRLSSRSPMAVPCLGDRELPSDGSSPVLAQSSGSIGHTRSFLAQTRGSRALPSAFEFAGPEGPFALSQAFEPLVHEWDSVAPQTHPSCRSTVRYDRWVFLEIYPSVLASCSFFYCAEFITSTNMYLMLHDIYLMK